MKPKRDQAEGQGVLMPDLPDQRPPEEARRDEDFYPTGQPEAIRALLRREAGRLSPPGPIWEPAVGDGALAREMEAAGFTVLCSDLCYRGWPSTELRSFYEYSEARAPVIITNPPFCEINARDGRGNWLRHLLRLSGWDYCAMLLSWDWPAARANGLGALLDEHTFTCAYLMRWKLDFTGAGSPPQRNAWFVWDRRDPRSWSDPSLPFPSFQRLDRHDDDRQAHLFDGDWGAG
nr:hypothetical protein [Roseovarius pacificus]